MRRVLPFALVAVACLGLASCQPKAVGFSDQDRAAIRKIVDDGTKIVNTPKPDFAAYVKLYYAEDGMILVPNRPLVQGRAAIQAMYESFPPISAFVADIAEIDGREDLAYVRGSYSMSMTPPGAAVITDRGKYVEVWRKGADGAWKVTYENWSSDLPVPGLIVPTGAQAGTAGAEAGRLSEVVGRWRIEGTARPDPNAQPGPVALALDCQWFASGLEVVCAYNGSSAGRPYQEADVYSYDARTKSYSMYSVVNPGGIMQGKLTIQPGTWVHMWDAQMEGRPVRIRLTLTEMTPAGGKWKTELSVAWGPWAAIGEGTFSKAG